MKTLEEALTPRPAKFVCAECHHAPSGRHAGPAPCYCKCHNLADMCPDTLTALLNVTQLYAPLDLQPVDGAALKAKLITLFPQLKEHLQ